MLKAILYYILLIAEFVVTLIIAGLATGVYFAFAAQNGTNYPHQTDIERIAIPMVAFFTLLSGLFVWFTFSHYKFSKFSLGKVQPAAKWKAMLYATLPILGFTLAFYASMNLFHIDFMPKEITQMTFVTWLPSALVGSFFSAYVFYGAIQEELIRCGKKLWVQMLTLCLMMLPACLMVVTKNGDISAHFTILGMISTIYACWVYQKTRSTIVLLVVYFIPNLTPSAITSTPLCIILLAVGAIMTISSWIILQKNMPKMLLSEDENE